MHNVKYNLSEDGFCFLPKIFSSSQIESARNGLCDVIQGNYETGIPPENRFWDVGDDPKNIIKIDKPHLCNKKIWDLLTLPDFGEILAQTVGAKMIQIWHSQLVWKPTGGGKKGHAGWHRDTQYWPFWKPYGVYTAWIALSDVNEESGPVRYICSSNNWDDISGMDFFDKNIASQNKVLKKTHNNFKIVSANIEKGQAIIHTSRVYHSSGPNISKGPRIGMVVHFCTNMAERIDITGDHSDYLDQIENKSICPIIYKK